MVEKKKTRSPILMNKTDFFATQNAGGSGSSARDYHEQKEAVNYNFIFFFHETV